VISVYPASDLDAVDFLGIRISDIYSNVDMMDIARKPLSAAFRKYDWQPPWEQRKGYR
jgi:hypothetical protein